METNKRKTRIRCLALVLAVSTVLGVTAFAANSIRTAKIEANYMDIKLVVDGIEVTPKDVNGNIVEPFASEGTTYLPVRAVASALGKDVTWDGENKTVYIGPVPGETESWMKKLPPYQVNSDSKIYNGSDAKSYFTVGGVNHTEGILLCGDTVTSSNKRGYALWNTNLQYRSMSFSIGHIDGASEVSVTLEVYLDGELSGEYEINWDDPIQKLTIPLNYSANVKLQCNKPETGNTGYNAKYGIFDISFAK